MIKNIVILGAGNVAHHLVPAFLNANINVLYVFSRTIKSAKILGEKYNIRYGNKLFNIPENADAYFFILSDTGLKEQVKCFPFKNKLLIHTAGSISMDIFKSLTNDYAVFYPFQTFRKEIEINFSEVPICIESSSESITNQLIEMSNSFNCKHYLLDSKDREMLHLAAVFACNFVTHNLHIGENILAENNIEKAIITPLIEQTISNILSFSASKSQTGPAYRGDKEIIEKHLSLLNKTALKNVYKTTSDSISELKNTKND
jgi:predicted short-subunit dehydrogenase-like oxidoreductase (DUF2520 family)